MIVLDLSKYKEKDRPRTFSGRDRGEEIRGFLNLDVLDVDGNQYEISIPDEIVCTSSPFILGVVGDSIKFLGESKFRNKYTISKYEKHRHAIETAITEALIEKAIW